MRRAVDVRRIRARLWVQRDVRASGCLREVRRAVTRGDEKARRDELAGAEDVVGADDGDVRVGIPVEAAVDDRAGGRCDHECRGERAEKD